MADPVDAPNRRRHERLRPHAESPIAVALTVGGVSVKVARVLDVSDGGLLVELEHGAAPPALGSGGRASLRVGATQQERAGRIIRVRWGGRSGGTPVAPALAIAFVDDGDTL